jgi:hypothetical protein
MPVESIRRLVDRIRQAFVTEPELQVTLWQAQRRWGMDELVSEHVFEVLVAGRFLSRKRDGAFVARGAAEGERQSAIGAAKSLPPPSRTARAAAVRMTSGGDQAFSPEDAGGAPRSQT